ncbi:hypothetical protein BURPS406E_P0405 [Burkholderia pseudomallei 406e]|uniref:Uncharacterized protein n=1 Tax=Burkholderia pseudomallei (strain 1106a) TaxID=357348 RepID=A3P1H4_BURP0|nr:hypothetical protein BURPS1106A_A0141 [Burkholderia pseudomallei 1106a]AFR18077.1 hypothetical protein BPC006_II0137 [Burkholderia pseudomallei BPC006]EBA48117.1 hypothetical protein BURPS305_3705 [Burkholderia pseudomallei 305]EDO86676.1 hypothetical protein BURPS406E_P0405 [Burkholderia pseudomallei 406e]EDU10535.1 hypothetical protein BURPS1655_C0656 [Burkholderia pseudomallei 1655]EEP52186.1 hypothetical protein GBP346_B2805 [Burkholderia pseudomallei MSHR346]EES22847.1 hypothetical pr
MRPKAARFAAGAARRAAPHRDALARATAERVKRGCAGIPR